MPVMVAIVVEEGLKKIEFWPKPFNIATVGFHEKCGMLCQTGLSHVFFVNMFWLGKAITTGQDGNPTVHPAEFKKVQYAPALVGLRAFQLRTDSDIGEDLS